MLQAPLRLLRGATMKERRRRRPFPSRRATARSKFGQRRAARHLHQVTSRGNPLRPRHPAAGARRRLRGTVARGILGKQNLFRAPGRGPLDQRAWLWDPSVAAGRAGRRGQNGLDCTEKAVVFLLARPRASPRLAVANSRRRCRGGRPEARRRTPSSRWRWPAGGDPSSFSSSTGVTLASTSKAP